jgi:hypothetical protein
VLEVEDSEFGEAPKYYTGALHHLLYVGAIARLSVSGSRFQQGFRGHLIKSRARENSILYNLLVDGTGGSASYELEFPNGGLAWVIGNVIGQSATTDNPDLISYGAEGQRWPDNALYLAHNTLIDDKLDGRFLRVWTIACRRGPRSGPSTTCSSGAALLRRKRPVAMMATRSLTDPCWSMCMRCPSPCRATRRCAEKPGLPASFASRV